MAEATPKPCSLLEGTVGAVEGRGKRRYVVVNVRDEEWLKSRPSTVTFTLTDWKGTRLPRHGQVVIMTGLEKFDKGWRAQSAEPVPA